MGTTLESSQPWKGSINSVFVINPLHPNWTAENQARLLAYLKARGGIA